MARAGFFMAANVSHGRGRRCKRQTARYDSKDAFFCKFLLALVVLRGAGPRAAWVWAGRQTGPTIEIRQPGKFIGQSATSICWCRRRADDSRRSTSPSNRTASRFPVYALDQRERTTVNTGAADKMFVMRPIGKKTIPDLQAGAARIVVRATRPVFVRLATGWNRPRRVTCRCDCSRRWSPCSRRSTSSTLAGSGVRRLFARRRKDVASGVRVGDIEYPGYRAKGAAWHRRDSAQRVRHSSRASTTRIPTSHQGLRARSGRQ
jgi:hypothetical protein